MSITDTEPQDTKELCFSMTVGDLIAWMEANNYTTATLNLHSPIIFGTEEVEGMAPDFVCPGCDTPLDATEYAANSCPNCGFEGWL